jgi:membrane fusion protein, multidrug efflux system
LTSFIANAINIIITTAINKNDPMNTPALSTLPAQNPHMPSPARPTVEVARNNHQSQNVFNDPPGAPMPGGHRKLGVKRVALGALVLLAGLGVVREAHTWWMVGRFLESTDDAYIGGDVTVIAPKVAGFISKLAISDNQQVHAGDLLLTLDDKDYLAALARADAGVILQQAALTNLDATRRLQEAVVAQAQATIVATEAQIVRTHDDQVRFTHLLKDSAVSVQESQRADADYKEAAAIGEKARAGLAAAQRQLEVIDTQKQQVQAALGQALAEQELARLNLSYTELRAPVDGTIGNRSAQVGAYASTGSQLISLVPAHGLWVDANFKENQLARIRPGLSATVKVDSIPGKVFRGRVLSVAPATGAQFSVLPPENATGNFTKIVQRVAVRIAIDDEEAAAGQLRPGLSVTAKVDVRTANDGSVARAGL